jgi:hypothetical protein
MLLSLKLLHKLLTQGDVVKHVGDLVDNVVATFHLQLRNHSLLCLVGDAGLVKKTPTEVSGVVTNEDVTIM